jgi:hypothetical protein
VVPEIFAVVRPPGDHHLIVVAFMFALFFALKATPTEVALAVSLLFASVFWFMRDALEWFVQPGTLDHCGDKFIVMGALSVPPDCWTRLLHCGNVQRQDLPHWRWRTNGLCRAGVSAIAPNTPVVVVVMIPILCGWAKLRGAFGVQAIDPLVHGAILGGTLTLIGTSTIPLADGVASR